MATGAQGLGTYQSVIAGTFARRMRHPAYYPAAREQLKLLTYHRDVLQKLAIRDGVFDNRFPEAQRVNGHFRLMPPVRRAYHLDDVMPAIRKRTILLQRLRRQRALNAQAIAEAKQKNLPDPRDKFRTADAGMYFTPANGSAKSGGNYGANAMPNFWMHESVKGHLVPRVQWRRHPELGGITRVSSAEYQRKNRSLPAMTY